MDDDTEALEIQNFKNIVTQLVKSTLIANN